MQTLCGGRVCGGEEHGIVAGTSRVSGGRGGEDELGETRLSPCEAVWP